MSARSILSALALASAFACGAPGPVMIPATHTRFDALEAHRHDELRAARTAFEARDFTAAHAAFERLLAEFPENICVGTWVEECEFARGDAPEAIAGRWAEREEQRPSVSNAVLAARVATTREARDVLLLRAEALDPQCAWIHYARAFDAALVSDWPLARTHIARAKEADPGHLWTWWLEAWISTRTETLEYALSALQGFVKAARDDPRIPRTLLDQSRLDLALAWTLYDAPGEARDLLAEVDPNGPDAARRLAALAQVQVALGDLKAALRAAEDAEKVAPDEILPVVQQALLYDEWIQDDVAAEAAWKRALEIARSSTKLVSALERTRASVRLERFAAERAQKTRP